MARLITTGFEISASTGESTTQVGPADGQATGTVVIDSTVQRSGSSSAKCTNSTSYVKFAPGRTADVIDPIYVRAYMRFSDATPTNNLTIMSFHDFNGGAPVANCNLKLTTTGVLQLRDGADAVTIATGATTLADNTWYRIEMKLDLVSAANDNYEVRIEGVTEFSGTAAMSAQLTSNEVRVGNVSGTVTQDTWIDDLAINDETLSNEISWPGSGKIVLCKPVSDSQDGTWTGGVGGTGDLSTAVDNTPPIGTATETDLTQIESIDSTGDNSTDEYRANLTTYTNAGIVATDTIKLVQPVVNHGEDVATGTKTGSFGMQANPSGTYRTFNYGNDVGALGTWPTSWRWTEGSPSYSPTVTLGSNPVLAVRKTDSGTRVTSVDFMGLYVEYTNLERLFANPATDFDMALV